MPGSPRRYALCGLSSRGLRLFAVPLLGPRGPNDAGVDLSAHGSLVGVLDVDAERLRRFAERVDGDLPVFGAAEFDRMVDETRPDAVLVASPDHTHAEYITKALTHGLDVISEKPLASTAAQARAILDAERESSGSVLVTHNVRYAARSRLLKRLLLDGVVGRVTSIELVWNVDTLHGSSYFTRWNRVRAASGGLTVHKSCHHIDLINWLVDDQPEQVFSYGALNFFGPESPHRPQGSTGDELQACAYFQEWQRRGEPVVTGFARPRPAAYDLPYDIQYPPEKSRYIYDAEIDVEDTYSAVIRYRGGASMTYAITFSAPWEGFRLGINGTHGRIEANVTSSGVAGPHESGDTIVVTPLFGERREIEVPRVEGSHDGADPLLQNDVFIGQSMESEELGLIATSQQAAVAVATGEAMWRSVLDNRPYDVAELLGDQA